MKSHFRTMLLFFIAFSISLMTQADSLCGDKGFFNTVLNLCQGYNGGVWSAGSRGSSNTQQHTPRDYFGAIAADVVEGKESARANNHVSAAAAKQAALQGCGLPGCKVIIAYKNGCGATATSSLRNVVGGIGDTPEEAEQNALDKCEQTKNGGQCQIWSRAKCSYYE
ncbi:DUF4189 domain-containing protein [Leeia sp. TBRC 13508]|uniref:DUF4189 domain-containing protein n=1 Tax=Leeia speluncae TaxID=2884804 RepID=A0ABS8D3R1_9NEIS|nr:DUF4189 domain-containing protein [Leeia speluncae]MCB6182807.1 DUF4189 domain-containing protein [Leeia speluncae]